MARNVGTPRGQDEETLAAQKHCDSERVVSSRICVSAAVLGSAIRGALDDDDVSAPDHGAGGRSATLPDE